MGILGISLHLQLYKCQIFLQKQKEGKRNGERLKVQKEREILKKGENSKTFVWKKRSILFNLPYWEVCAHINLRTEMYDA